MTKHMNVRSKRGPDGFDGESGACLVSGIIGVYTFITRCTLGVLVALVFFIILYKTFKQFA